MSPEVRHIEEELRRALKMARDRYDSGEGNVDEYFWALRHFSDYVLHGTVPDNLARNRHPAPPEQRVTKRLSE